MYIDSGQGFHILLEEGDDAEAAITIIVISINIIIIIIIIIVMKILQPWLLSFLFLL